MMNPNKKTKPIIKPITKAVLQPLVSVWPTRAASSALALALACLLATSASGQSNPRNALKTIKVGIVHSFTGTMAISEIAVAHATELAINEINSRGGVLGQKLVLRKRDGGSDWPTFARMAERLILEDQVAVVFGGWTSASRQAMLPVFEKNQHLLFYPVQFEGNECSPNIVYTGAQPNQQALPALDWLRAQGYKRIFLLGSDYVYPRSINAILKRHMLKNKLTLAGERYVELGSNKFGPVLAAIKASKADVIINTLNGSSNVAFFGQYSDLGLKPSTLSTMSFSIAEPELQAIGVKRMQGHWTSWNYFQSLPNPANARFIQAYQSFFGSQASISDPMAHAYVGVYLWKAAAERARSLDPLLVRQALSGLSLNDSPLGPISVAANGSLNQRAYIGEADARGQFRLRWSSPSIIKPQPYDPLVFPNKTCP
jgi:urea transport system substrate-binding protein